MAGTSSKNKTVEAGASPAALPYHQISGRLPAQNNMGEINKTTSTPHHADAPCGADMSDGPIRRPKPPWAMAARAKSITSKLASRATVANVLSPAVPKVNGTAIGSDARSIHPAIIGKLCNAGITLQPSVLRVTNRQNRKSPCPPGLISRLVITAAVAISRITLVNTHPIGSITNQCNVSFDGTVPNVRG